MIWFDLTCAQKFAAKRSLLNFGTFTRKTTYIQMQKVQINRDLGENIDKEMEILVH